MRIIGIISILILSSCGFRSYFLKNADKISLWYLDRELDLQPKQKAHLELALRKNWLLLRCQKIPEMAKAIKHFAEKYRQHGLKEELLESTLTMLTHHLRELGVLLLPAVSDLLRSLDAKQWKALQEKLVKTQEKDLKLVNLKGHAFKSQYQKKLNAIFEKWYGKISPDQAKILWTIAGAEPQYLREGTLQIAHAQHNFVEYFQNRPSAQDVIKQLREWLEEPATLRDTSMQEAYLARQQKWLKNLLLVDALTSMKQRETLYQKIVDFAEDLEEVEAKPSQCRAIAI